MKSKITFYLSNGDKYETIGYRNILLDMLDSKYDYMLVDFNTYIMKNNINYITIEDIKEEGEKENVNETK